MDLRPGFVLGGYRIVETLVAGGTAKVYRATQLSANREVAVKVLPDMGSAEALARFQREARLLAQLQHPNILSLIDVGNDGAINYFVLPLMRSGDLADRIAREDGPLPLVDARRIALQLADALAYAHAQGFVHRDLKPANVLLDEHGNGLLSDFGIALPEREERLTQLGYAIGTPEYLAPEQIDGVADARSDIYALGLILFEVVTGRRPFSAKASTEWLRAHREQTPTSPRSLNPDLPEAVERLILKALAKNPNERFQNATEFADAARAAFPDTRVAPPTRAVITAERAAAPASAAKTKGARWALVAAILVLVAVAGVWAMRGTQSRDRDAALVSAPALVTPAEAPRALATPSPVATPPAAVDFVDDFDAPALDESHWHRSRADARASYAQQDGRLDIRTRERDAGVYASVGNGRGVRATVRVRMDAPVDATESSVGMTLSRAERAGQWVSCYVYAARGTSVATPACTDQRRTQFPAGQPAKIGDWHTLTIVADPATHRARFELDGKPAGELPIDGGDAASDWYVLLSGWSADGTEVRGAFHSVRVEIDR